MSDATILIADQWRGAENGKTIPVIDPATGQEYAQLAAGTAGDIDAAVTAAQAALDGAWGKFAAFERGRILGRMAELVAAHGEELAQIEARDTGKPMKQARADMVACARYFEFYAGAADKIHGDTIPFLDGYMALSLREAHGVTAHIIPWNYPAQMFGRTIGGAIAMGNACVIKPAEEACLSVVRLTQLMQQAGLPTGALNLVTGYGEEAGAALSAHPGINHLSFTGSPEVGSLIQAATGRNNVSCTMELGGKSAQIVFADADLDQALPILVNAIVQNAGQTCSAGSRILIEQSIYEPLMARVAERFATLRVGSWQQDFDCGPLISARQRDRVQGFIDRAKADGIPLLATGTVDAGVDPNGFFVAPALFGPVPRPNRLSCDEVFGPVLAAFPFADEEDAIRLANSTDYGLVAGLWTSNGARQMRVAKKLRCGQVFVNCYGAGGGIELPFGGVKRSGYGREKGFEALLHFSAPKTVLFKHD